MIGQSVGERVRRIVGTGSEAARRYRRRIEDDAAHLLAWVSHVRLRDVAEFKCVRIDYRERSSHARRMRGTEIVHPFQRDIASRYPDEAVPLRHKYPAQEAVFTDRRQTAG